MLERAELTFTEPPTKIQVPLHGVTLLVGPNNSGKSLALLEIRHAIEAPLEPRRMVTNITHRAPEESVLKRLLSQIAPTDIDWDSDEYINVGLGDHQKYIPKQLIGEVIRNEAVRRRVFIQRYTVHLDVGARIGVLQKARGSLERQLSARACLFMNDEVYRNLVNELIREIFPRWWLVRDPLTEYGNVVFRLSTSPTNGLEFHISGKKREKPASMLPVYETSDGIRAYLGTILHAASGLVRTLLVDEPDAFLHPPLARKLGTQLSRLAQQKTFQLLAATHSADFVIGCLLGPSDARILRLEYRDGKSRGRLVEADTLRRFFNDPLFRSAHVFSALFHDGAVVTESDNDRAFYEEIAYRLGEVESGLPWARFLAAQNRQTVHRIVGALRTMGVPAAAIVDLDFLRGEGDWNALLDPASVPSPLRQGWSQTRALLQQAFTQHGNPSMPQPGIHMLPSDNKESASNLLSNLAEYGIFVVPSGELTSWLPELAVPANKGSWVTQVFKRLGSNPAAPAYVRPGQGDVWDFLRKLLLEWIGRPDRKGLPD
ncbi:MAG: AAA family ATPase [Geminicoccaceae bacterium]|nr:AAA family ATPase [Geminicoccaceae bacterium]